jgi:hypothetical protein
MCRWYLEGGLCPKIDIGRWKIHKLYNMCTNVGKCKIWPYYMYNIKSWIFSYKVVKDFSITWMKFVRVCFHIIRQIGQSINHIQFYIVTFK